MSHEPAVGVYAIDKGNTNYLAAENMSRMYVAYEQGRSGIYLSTLQDLNVAPRWPNCTVTPEEITASKLDIH